MKTINQKIDFDAKPEEIYNAILDPIIHSKFTGSKATGDMKEKGKFTAYDDYIFGENIKLVKNKKIVQKWSCSDFPDGHFTEATFTFIKEGTQAILEFTQKNVPDENYEDITEGWHEYYWKPLKIFLSKKTKH